MIIEKSLSEKGKIAGITLVEMGMLWVVIGGLAVAINIVNIFIYISGYWYLALLALGIIFHSILKRAAKTGNPSFLLSWYSFHFKQPKVLLAEKNIGYVQKKIKDIR